MTLPSSFTGAELLAWLGEHVVSLDERKRGEAYASEMLRRGFLTPYVRKNSFTPQSYYTINEEKLAANTMRRGVLTPLDINAADGGGAAAAATQMLDDSIAAAAAHKCSRACAIKRFFCLHQPALAGRSHKKRKSVA